MGWLVMALLTAAGVTGLMVSLVRRDLSGQAEKRVKEQVRRARLRARYADYQAGGGTTDFDGFVTVVAAIEAASHHDSGSHDSGGGDGGH
jgi:hypothetical protein